MLGNPPKDNNLSIFAQQTAHVNALELLHHSVDVGDWDTGQWLSLNSKDQPSLSSPLTKINND